MKNLLGFFILILLTSCSYNIDNSVGGSITTTSNTFRGYTPTVVNRPYILAPNPAAIASYYYTPPFYAYGWYRPWGYFW